MNEQENMFDTPTTLESSSNATPVVADSVVDLSSEEQAEREIAKVALPDDVLRRFADVYTSLNRELDKVFVGQPELILGSSRSFQGGMFLSKALRDLEKRFLPPP